MMQTLSAQSTQEQTVTTVLTIWATYHADGAQLPTNVYQEMKQGLTKMPAKNGTSPVMINASKNLLSLSQTM